MAKNIQRLTAMAVTRASKPGLYADGAGLYLRISRNGSKSWAFRFMLNGKSREMGLGGLTKVSLADAREKATDVRRLLGDGYDPLTLRQEEDARRAAVEKLTAAHAMTFDSCADAYISAHEISWRNEKHRHQWRNTLTTYVSPVFWPLAGPKHRHRSHYESDRATLERKDGTRAPRAWSDRGRTRLGQSAGISNRRKSSTLARKSRSPFASTIKGASGKAPCRPPLLRD